MYIRYFDDSYFPLPSFVLLPLLSGPLLILSTFMSKKKRRKVFGGTAV
jgi:hypothetical protein